jgi:hypothetical protein
MNIKAEIRNIFIYLVTQEQGRDEHGNNGFVVLSGQKYFVGVRRNGEWYLEPYQKNRTEWPRFPDNTLHDGDDLYEILQLFVENDLLTISQKI